MSADLSHWKPRPSPERIVLEGRYARLEPLDKALHGEGLFEASAAPGAEDRFRYLFEEAPATRARFQPWLDKMEPSLDPMFWVVIDGATGGIGGRQALMRIDPAHGAIEIGSILWGPEIARTRIATEALFLFARYVFDELGYRRLEWKCNDDNGPSKRAAIRFGFAFEGVFRQHMVVKGRNRDTAWYAMIDAEWPAVREGFQRWLTPDNFDAQGLQRIGLAVAIAEARAGAFPKLRRATPADRPLLEALQRDAYAKNTPILGVTPLPLSADYGVIMHECEVWLAEDEKGPNGALILRPQVNHLELWSIAVASRAQGKGIGNRLLKAAEHRAKDLGYRMVRLLTGEKLTANVNWYKRNGFSVERIEQLPDRRVAHLSKWIT